MADPSGEAVSTTELMRDARLAAAQHMLGQAGMKVVTWERHVRRTDLTPQDRRKLTAELDLWKKINDLAAREVRKWSPPDVG